MFDIILKNFSQRKLRTGLTIFGIALGIFAVMVMGGMSEHFSMTVERSISLTADKIRVLPDVGLFGASLNASKANEVKRIPESPMLTGFCRCLLILTAWDSQAMW